MESNDTEPKDTEPNDIKPKDIKPKDMKSKGMEPEDMEPMYIGDDEYNIQRPDSFMDLLLDYDSELDFNGGYCEVGLEEDYSDDDDKGAGANANTNVGGGEVKETLLDRSAMANVKAKKDSDRVACDDEERLKRLIKELTLNVNKLEFSIKNKDEEKNMWQRSAIELQRQLNDLRNMEGVTDEA